MSSRNKCLFISRQQVCCELQTDEPSGPEGVKRSGVGQSGHGAEEDGNQTGDLLPEVAAAALLLHLLGD